MSQAHAPAFHLNRANIGIFSQFLEKPTGHAAGDMLDEAGAQVVEADGADAPGMVVKVLPVEEAEFPVSSPLVPPLPCHIMMFLAVTVQQGRIAVLSGRLINLPGRQQPENQNNLGASHSVRHHKPDSREFKLKLFFNDSFLNQQ